MASSRALAAPLTARRPPPWARHPGRRAVARPSAGPRRGRPARGGAARRAPPTRRRPGRAGTAGWRASLGPGGGDELAHVRRGGFVRAPRLTRPRGAGAAPGALVAGESQAAARNSIAWMSLIARH